MLNQSAEELSCHLSPTVRTHEIRFAVGVRVHVVNLNGILSSPICIFSRTGEVSSDQLRRVHMIVLALHLISFLVTGTQPRDIATKLCGGPMVSLDLDHIDAWFASVHTKALLVRLDDRVLDHACPDLEQRGRARILTTFLTLLVSAHAVISGAPSKRQLCSVRSGQPPLHVLDLL